MSPLVSPSQADLSGFADAFSAFEAVSEGRRSLAEAGLYQALLERHRLLEKTLELERQRRETFVATMAHELRQPLSSLLGAVEMVRAARDSAAATPSVEVMTRQIAQMNRVVDDLMDATRWACGKVAVRKQRIDLRDVIRNAECDVAAAIAARGHRLVVARAPEPLWVDGDPQRLQQLLANLLHNAASCTDPGGRIVLVAERLAATVMLIVSDTGRGIGADALPHVFDLYSQERPSDATGLGLGLSVAREIILLHDGSIEARSAGIGLGSEFIVTLPRALSSASVLVDLARLDTTRAALIIV